jgi:16S rRNA (cytosine967-C5)-methyltransferase
MSSPGLAPRRAAVHLLNGVIEEARLLPEMLPGAVQHLAPDERARAVRLATTCLRWMDRADRVLGPHLRALPPAPVMNVLRLGVVEMLVDRAAAHGVVNTAVDMVRADKATQRMAGLVNAVLRKVARMPVEKWDALPAPQLPKWLRKPLIADYRKPAVIAMERAYAAGAPLDITVKSDAAGWAQELGGSVTPTGSVRVAGSVQVSALPGYEDGAWWVQDAAAALPAVLLKVAQGERVLDICAAPGGKTMQLAATGANVTALDISDVRLNRVRENLERTGLSAEVIVADALTYDGAPFDAILLDAPCTATGTIRRHPDLPYAKTSEGFPALFALQEKMLDRALALLKPGGRMVYCTCSLLIDEGEEQIRDLIARAPDVAIDNAALDAADLPTAWRVAEGLRTRPDYWPELGGMDGFFMTVLQKPA